MIGQMAIAIALLGFNDLGRSVTLTLLFRNSSNCNILGLEASVAFFVIAARFTQI